ncbi:hypothetical protein BM221_006589 [Beauveria bassiana]|uniref:Uncharacterized protein n=1 Tax=Beauveria bassiana TaxID=176275 RepID=A0A2N6NI45_BEABA|nr:hypothetical protein BM221_006589 [Beauveria bassiana]
MDVSGDETINAAYETVEARSGYLDVLVNNDILPEPPAGSRWPKQNVVNSGCVLVEQDGAQHDDSGVALEVKGGRRQGLERVVRISDDRSGRRQESVQGARGGGSGAIGVALIGSVIEGKRDGDAGIPVKLDG